MNLPEVDTTRRDQLLAIEELKENRLAARKDARSGNPAKSIPGQIAVKAITHMIAQRHLLIRQEDEK